jgi:hypothetical protein
MHDKSSEFLGPNHGHEQVDEQQQSNDARDDGFHRVLLEFFAKPGVKAADDEEAGDNADKNQITHKTFPPAIRFRMDTLSRQRNPQPAAA